MRPAFQTILHGPSDVPEERGDCYRAAIASVLELDTLDVPHFVAIDGDGWWDAVQEFVGQFGLRVEYINLDEHPGFRELQVPGYWIASVESPRNPAFNHCVVVDGDEIVHDPWPREPRMAGALDRGKLKLIEFFVAIDPSFAVRGASQAVAA